MGKVGRHCGKRDISSSKQTNRDIFPAWAKEVEECEEYYEVSKKSGLSSGDVERRRATYGYNELEKHERPSIWSLILEQFNDTLVWIILAAAVTSFVLAWYDGGEEDGEMQITAFVEPLVMFLILTVSSIVRVWQESKAAKALEALKEIQSSHATVVRDSHRIPNFPAKELVPGDIVELKVGDKVPADMRVVELISSMLRIEQGSLTGESEAVDKTTKAAFEDTDIQGKRCMVFAGTSVVNGNCVCLVTQTGVETEIGKVHKQIRAASKSKEDTPLKKKLNEFGVALTEIIGVICALVWLINVKHFFTWEYVNGWPCNFKFSSAKCSSCFEIVVALAVAAIPVCLPAVITACLALGTRKMARKNCLVRKLSSVETLGCTTVICSDKTGTLTTNQMAVAKLVAMGPGVETVRTFKVDGTTYNPCDGRIHEWPTGGMDANLQMIAKISALCNDAGVTRSERRYVAVGIPSDAALKVLVEKMGLPEGSRDDDRSSSRTSDLLRCCQWWNKIEKRIATLEFDRYRKSMGVIVSSPSGKKSLLVKGAVENVLERSTSIQLLDGSVVEMDQNSRNLILEALQEMSTGALSCLGFAYKDELSEFDTYGGDEDHPAHGLLLDPSNYSSIESKLIFVGLVGLRDPPRDEVHQAIEDCRAAGIRVIVITGDNKNTAEAICREIGLFEPEEDISLKSLRGKDFMDLPDQKAHLRQRGALLFSRAEPRLKQDIVRLLKEDGEVVAMTGDGANDAPALKLADIGIAMGIAGTEVAKEASDMVLADDNFSTIVAAVGEGRSIYNNMKAFIRDMISSNIGEVASVFLTASLGIPVVLIPVQLLWVNLVIGGLPATDVDVMKKPPRRSNDSLISAWILFRSLVIGLYVGLATVGIFIIWYTHGSFLGIDLSGDGHTLVTYSQLANWDQCSSWENFMVSGFTAGAQVIAFDNYPCDYFHRGKVKAMTLSLSVLVAIEMFNSLNALSEDGSLLTMLPGVNPWLLLTMSVSFGLHFLILYVPFVAHIFGIVPLSFNEWLLVLTVALPVILIAEILKFVGRCTRVSGFIRPNTRIQDQSRRKVQSKGERFAKSKGGEAKVRISSLLVQASINQMQLYLIGKIWGQPISLNMIKTKLQVLWYPIVGWIDFTNLGNEFYLIKFAEEADYLNVKNNGPWIVEGKYFVIQKWVPRFDPYEARLTKALVWVKIARLPLEYWTPDILAEIVSPIGEFMKLDRKTETKERGKYVRVCVNANIDQSLPQVITMEEEGFSQTVKCFYECLSTVCYWCSEHGHEVAECPLMPESEADINWKFLKELLQSFDEEKPKETSDDGSDDPSLSNLLSKKDNRNQRNLILPSDIAEVSGAARRGERGRAYGRGTACTVASEVSLVHDYISLHGAQGGSGSGSPDDIMVSSAFSGPNIDNRSTDVACVGPEKTHNTTNVDEVSSIGEDEGKDNEFDDETPNQGRNQDFSLGGPRFKTSNENFAC